MGIHARSVMKGWYFAKGDRQSRKNLNLLYLAVDDETGVSSVGGSYLTASVILPSRSFSIIFSAS